VAETGAALCLSACLVCAHDQARGTYLARQAFAAPIHLSKSYWDGATLLVNVVNQTAGMFGGDTITAHVVVEPGARVLLSSPSAARFHPSHGREARYRQVFEVRTGACLDVFPEISIPQRESRSQQETSIQIEPGGELIFLETLAPGRIASGEAFAFARYAWSTDIRVGSQLVHRERADVSPGNASCAGLRAFFAAGYYAGLVIISPAAEQWGADFAEAVAQTGRELAVQVGASRLNAHGWSIRLLAGDSVSLREAIRRLRELVYQRLGRPLPDARRGG
jgi:urease accessory protein